MTAARFQVELDHLRACTASSRKSFSEYKPLIVWVQNGVQRTEVLGRATVVDELKNFRQTFSRGVIFTDREEAIDYARKTIQLRIDDCFARAKKYGFDIS